LIFETVFTLTTRSFFKCPSLCHSSPGVFEHITAIEASTRQQLLRTCQKQRM
jgi:hypothetical protein